MRALFVPAVVVSDLSVTMTSGFPTQPAIHRNSIPVVPGVLTATHESLSGTGKNDSIPSARGAGCDGFTYQTSESPGFKMTRATLEICSLLLPSFALPS